MALFLVTNNLTRRRRARPEPRAGVPRVGGRSDLGPHGPAPGGFPPKVQQARAARPEAADRPARRRRCRRPTSRPSPHEAARARSAASRANAERARRTCSIRKCFPSSSRTRQKYSDVSVLPTDVFFYGQEPGEEMAVEIEPGKTLIVKFLTVGDPHPDGRRTVFFELNGQPREHQRPRRLARAARKSTAQGRPRRSATKSAAPMPGLVVTVAVKVGRHGAAGPEAALDRGHEDGDDASTPSRPARSPSCWSRPAPRSTRTIC